MKKVKLHITDERMLQLPDILKQNKKIRYRQEFCDAIEMPKQNIRNVRMGIQHFQGHHIAKACKAFGVNANWIVGTGEAIFNRVVAGTKRVTKKEKTETSTSKIKK